MKTKFFLFAMVAVFFAACNSNEPEQSSQSYTGNIIATLGCKDEMDTSISYKGYIIEIDTKDTILTFNMDTKDSIFVQSGITVLHPAVTIPYSFSFKTLNSKDREYIHYTIPFQDAMREGLPKPLHEIEQVLLIPNK